MSRAVEVRSRQRRPRTGACFGAVALREQVPLYEGDRWQWCVMYAGSMALTQCAWHCLVAASRGSQGRARGHSVGARLWPWGAHLPEAFLGNSEGAEHKPQVGVQLERSRGEQPHCCVLGTAPCTLPSRGSLAAGTVGAREARKLDTGWGQPEEQDPSSCLEPSSRLRGKHWSKTGLLGEDVVSWRSPCVRGKSGVGRSTVSVRGSYLGPE